MGPDIASQLIEARCNVDAQNPNGNTALMEAARYNSPDIASQLIEAGCNVDAKGQRGKTALILAAYKNHPDIASQLIEAECDRCPDHSRQHCIDLCGVEQPSQHRSATN